MIRKRLPHRRVSVHLLCRIRGKLAVKERHNHKPAGLAHFGRPRRGLLCTGEPLNPAALAGLPSCWCCVLVPGTPPGQGEGRQPQGELGFCSSPLLQGGRRHFVWKSAAQRYLGAPSAARFTSAVNTLGHLSASVAGSDFPRGVLVWRASHVSLRKKFVISVEIQGNFVPFVFNFSDCL